MAVELRQQVWPFQSQCDTFYGNPRGRDGRASPAWEKANLTRVSPPFIMRYDGKPVRQIAIHKKCAESFLRIMEHLWEVAGREQRTVDYWGLSTYAGCFNFRVMRGGGALSMHAYACAIDLDPARNAWHDETPHFENYPWIIDAFEQEGWVWGGRWKGRACDGMHFQAARVG